MNSKKAALAYAKANVVTAGRLKSYLLLIDKAITLLNPIENNVSISNLIQVQNILVQIQISLNLRNPASRQIHKSLAHIWDVLESKNIAAIPRTVAILRQLREMIDSIDRNAN